MLLVDARRLTGPNHLALVPLVLVEVALAPDESPERALAAYLGELTRMRLALGLPGEVEALTRAHRGGAVFGYPAPIDEMLACTEMSEWAAESACATLAGAEPLPLEPRRSEVAAALGRDRNPARAALMAAAEARGLPTLWDDTHVSVGLGCRSVTYANDAVPPVAEVPWARLGSIPVALVTGTNGKTTSSRLLAHVGTTAGLVVGCTSTDGVVIGGELREEGDWTGPAAARLVLRDPSVQIAVLETARGGILRRGLALDRCSAALLTNVSADHVGAYGIDDVNAMTRVKGVVAEVVPPSGTVALNARDANLVGFAEGVRGRVTFFADLDAEATPAQREVLASHLAEGGAAVVAEGGEIVCVGPDRHGGLQRRVLARTDTLPLTFGGAARYNVENILGVVAAAEGLGLPERAIAQAIASFRNEDNPGRGALLERGGVQILLDFGHNPDGVRAVMRLVRALAAPAGPEARAPEITVIAGCAGDRSDADFTGIAQAIVGGGASRVIVRELHDYLRGRPPGEVPRLLAAACVAAGLPATAVTLAADEVDALARALTSARPGDLIALLVHVETAAVQAYLAATEPATLPTTR